MSTQLQRAFGLADGRREVPKSSEAKTPKRDARSDKKSGDKGDLFPHLPRRRLGIDKEG